ncbi:MAG: HlyD family efflux transporter periplasmic adaptor subunit [Aulosira sp. ZfuVER01]|nr:HlyD family efflux transporter periplasmic adaptor subunit [Aulosira sp. ZfuVER01]MDZ7998983.1 HlyD family efflux transporter periplasmic adaptor subunit [Aulosira sp. DedVER01a]MDZ8051293.1 HlyD family efflux transporter periplasmic adaptor subunit [Aulosira sp. ZfuCHP01]
MSEVNLPSIPNAKTEEVTNPDFLHPVSPNEFLPPISRWTSIGGIVLLSIFGTSMILTSILKYNVIIKASATIRPTGELRLVQAATEGTIKRIFVQENQVIKKGDIIAYVDDSRLKTQKNLLQTNIQQASLQLSQVNLQIRALDQQIAAESDRTNRTLAAAKAELNHSQRDIKDKQITSLAQVKEAEANLSQAQKELQKNQAQLKSAQANFKSSVAAVKAAKAKRDRYEPLTKVGSISQDQFQEVQLAVEQQEQLLVSQKANVEEHIAAVKQQQQAIAAAAARVQAAKSTLNPSDAIVAISQEKLAAESATGKVSLAKLNQERSQLLQQKVEIHKQLSRDRQEMQQVEREIAATVIRASASGIIQELNLRNTSQVIHTGDLVAQIAPNDSPLIIKALVAPGDISKVEKGQAVQLRVSSCSYADYGTLKGKVSAISPDAMSTTGYTYAPQAKSADTAERSATYEVTIQPDSLVLTAGSRRCAIQSGMEARADIISSEETVLKFLLRKARLLTDL